MKKLLLVLLMFVGMSVSCEKENWFSPEEVEEIRSEYQEQINALTISKNELLSQTTSLTTQIDDLNATVTALGVTNDDQLAEISTLTTSIDSLNTQVTTLDAEITTLTASNTDLTSQISTLNTEVTSLTTSATTLQASLDAALVDILILQDFKSIRDKLDTMVAATISDANLNTAIDSVSIGLTTPILSPSVLKGFINGQSNWIFNNAIKSGTVSMTSSVTTFYDNSTDTNVINFRTLVTEMTTAWNAAKESKFILWWIEFIKEYENL